jgi:hypothetical protein
VIPTEYKSKIPKTLSYPVGAKAISAALADVPQRELLKIKFVYWKGFVKDRVIGAPNRVLEASYSGPGVLSGWTIDVFPVPRPFKHVIQVKLIAEALPKATAWLKSNFHSTDREGGHHLTFSYDELKNEIIAEERSSTDWQTERV